MSNRSSDASNILGAIGVAIVVLIAMVPKPVWIALGIVAALGVVAYVSNKGRLTGLHAAAAVASRRERLSGGYSAIASQHQASAAVELAGVAPKTYQTYQTTV